MNPLRFLVVAFVAALAAGAKLSAQDPAPASPGEPAAPKSEMQKWIETTDAQWQEAFKKGVTDVHEAEVNKAKLQYVSALEEGIKKASAANDLKGALALRDEQKRFGDTQLFPEQDEAADAATVKQIRAVIRAQLAKVNADHAARAKGLHAKYDAALAQAQAQLTQKQRLDDALLVQTKRDEVKTAWLAGGAVTPAAAPISSVGAPMIKPADPNPPAVTTPTLSIHPHIGETIAETTRRFGVWPSNDLRRLPGTEGYYFDRNGFRAEVHLSEGKAVMVVLHQKGRKVSEDDLRQVMNANGEGHSWALDKKSNEWIRGDRKIKVFIAPGHSDFLFMQDMVAVNKLEKGATKPEEKPVVGRSTDEFFVGKAWQSSAGTSYSFAKDGTCVRQAGSSSETMRWHHLGNRIVEVAGKNKPDTRYFRFVSATEAYYSGDKNNITQPVQLK